MRPLPMAAAAVLVFAALLGLQRAWGDWLGRGQTIEAAREAVRVEPGNADAWLWLAEHEERSGGEPEAAFAEAMRLRPWDSRAWVRRGLYRESTGRRSDGEGDLLHASDIDRLSGARWALINYYYRSDKSSEFARLVRSLASGMAEEAAWDPKVLWNLCWKWPDRSSEWVEIASSKPVLRDGLLDFLETAEPHGQALAAAAEVYRDRSTPVKGGRAPRWCSRFIEGGRLDDARAVWARLAAAGEVVADDSRFERVPAGEGFGWRVAVPYTHLRPGIVLRFDGKQAEEMEVCWRWSERGGPRVEADWDAQPGFGWEVEVRGGLRRLALRYRRPVGSARFVGEVRVRSARVTSGRAE
ncbi:MAG: hypothetical protein R2729_24595 [Bryobacteraceae bacterium]